MMHHQNDVSNSQINTNVQHPTQENCQSEIQEQNLSSRPSLDALDMHKLEQSQFQLESKIQSQIQKHHSKQLQSDLSSKQDRLNNNQGSFVRILYKIMYFFLIIGIIVGIFVWISKNNQNIALQQKLSNQNDSALQKLNQIQQIIISQPKPSQSKTNVISLQQKQNIAGSQLSQKISQQKPLKSQQETVSSQSMRHKQKQSIYKIIKIQEKIPIISQEINIAKDLRSFLAIDEKFQISIEQKIIFSNNRQQTVSMLVKTKKQIYQQQNQIIPMYMWLGDKPIPQKYQKHLNSLYSYKFIRNCDGLIAMMQKKLNTKFKTIQKVNLRSDLCKAIYLHQFGGLYADIDTNIDLKCLNKFLKGKQNHVQCSKNGGPDLFLLYFKIPKNRELLKGIQKWDYYHSDRWYKNFFTPFLQQVKQKKVSRSNCVQHMQDRSWLVQNTQINGLQQKK